MLLLIKSGQQWKTSEAYRHICESQCANQHVLSQFILLLSLDTVKESDFGPFLAAFDVSESDNMPLNRLKPIIERIQVKGSTINMCRH